MTGRVFVVQEPMVWDEASRSKRPKFDMKPAAKYGEVTVLLAGSHSPLNTASMVRELHAKLADFGEADYILPTGNPTAIGLAISIAALNNGGNVQLLVWHRPIWEYVVAKANIYGKAT